MKSISHNLRKSLFFASLFFVLSTTIASAQDEFPDDVDDETAAAPIDGYIYAGLVVGSFLAIRKLKKTEIA